MRKKVLMMLAIMGFVFVGIGQRAYANMDAYLIKDSSENIVYEFNKDELSKSFLNFKRNKKASLYEEYAKLFVSNNLFALHDDTQKYVDYKDVKQAFLNSKRSGKPFDVDNYTEKLGKAMTNMPKKIKKVTAPDNKVVYTEVDTGSSSSEEVGDLEVISIE